MHAAVLLVALSPSPLEDYVRQADREASLPALREHWVSTGLMEENEHLFVSQWSLESDLEAMEWRLENVPVDAPPFVARHHLPDPSIAFGNYCDANQYIHSLEDIREWLLPGYEQEVLDDVIRDATERKEVWWLIYQATSTYQGRDGRRWNLNELRKKWPAEWAGEKGWPDPLPPHASLFNWRGQ